MADNIYNIQPGTLVHKDFPRYAATPDAIMVEGDPYTSDGKLAWEWAINANTNHLSWSPPDAWREVVEVKCPRSMRSWGPVSDGPFGIPQQYLGQTLWQLFVCQSFAPHLTRATLVANSEGELHKYAIDMEDPDHGQFLTDLLGGMIQKAEEFLTEYVDKKTPPPVDGSQSYQDYVAGQYPKVRKVSLLRSDNNVENWANEIMHCDEEIKVLEKRKRNARTRIQQVIGDHEGIRGPWGTITYKSRDRNSFDAKGALDALVGSGKVSLADVNAVKEKFTKKTSSRYFVPKWSK